MNKKDIYGSQKCDEDSSDIDDGKKKVKKGDVPTWYRPRNVEIKLIDFGGATYEKDHHTKIVNTR